MKNRCLKTESKHTYNKAIFVSIEFLHEKKRSWNLQSNVIILYLEIDSL